MLYTTRRAFVLVPVGVPAHVANRMSAVPGGAENGTATGDWAVGGVAGGVLNFRFCHFEEVDSRMRWNCGGY